MLKRGWTVPDFELPFQDSDGPIMWEGRAHQARVPVGSQSTSQTYVDLPIPQCGFYYWQGLAPEYRDTNFNVSIHDVLAVGAARPYASRTRKAVFRGSCNNQPRDEAAALSRQRPDVLDLRCSGGVRLANLSNWAVTVNFLGAWVVADGRAMSACWGSFSLCVGGE